MKNLNLYGNSRQSPDKQKYGKGSKQPYIISKYLNLCQLIKSESVTNQLSKNNRKHQASRMVSSN